MFRRMLTGVLTLMLPSLLAAFLLNLIGHRVSRHARIGFSFLGVSRLVLARGARVGHFNLFLCRRLVLHSDGRVGRANLVSGPISVRGGIKSLIGNSNKITRGGAHIRKAGSLLYIGEIAGITAGHRVDCTRSISIGDYSTIAGVGSQLWTHGYIHEESGPGRYRVDGTIRIGRNVYIGSMCVISAGVRIANCVIIGSGSSVGKSLDEPGLYVSQPLRHLPRPGPPGNNPKLEKLPSDFSCDRVYEKKS